MVGTKRTSTVTLHEWLTPAPAHQDDIWKAYAVADSQRKQEQQLGGDCSEIMFSSEDDAVIVISFSVKVGS